MKLKKIDLAEIKIYRKVRRKLRRLFGLEQMTRAIGSDAAMAIPFPYLIDYQPRTRFMIAVICHIYHQALSEEIFSYLQNLACAADVYISTDSPEKKATILDVFQKWEKGLVDVRIVENRGRDIAPKLIAFRDVYESHELILFLHSKRSTHAEDGNDWRRFLFNNLVGSGEITRSIVEIFERQPRVGAVIAQHWEPLRQWIIWKETFELAEDLCTRIGIRISSLRAIDFPSGSMFWMRSHAIKKLLELNLSTQDFPEESGQVGNTIAHAIERLFLICSEKSGFDWVKIAVPALYQDRRSIVEIRSPDQIAKFIEKHRHSLLHRHGNPKAERSQSHS